MAIENEEQRESYIPDDELANDPNDQLSEGVSAAMDGDRIGGDPIEREVQAPETWSEADKYGMTQYEQSHSRSLDERLAEERPDPATEQPQNQS